MNRGWMLAWSIFFQILMVSTLVVLPFVFLPANFLWGWKQIVLALVVPTAVISGNLVRSSWTKLLIILGVVVVFIALGGRSFWSKEQLALAGILGVGILAILIIDFLMIYLWWAPNNLFFTFIPEGRAKVVVRGDEVRKLFMRWTGHDLAPAAPARWDVIDALPKKHWFGGLTFYGIWPLDDIYMYKFSWTSMRQDGEKNEHMGEILDYVLVKEDVYLAVVSKAEDKLLVPVDIRIVLTIKVTNPYKALFNVQNWLGAIINRVSAAVRKAFTQNTYEEWVASKELINKIFTDPDMDNFLKIECRGHYGIDVRAIEVVDIDPGESYRQATLQKFLADQEAKRIKGVYDEIQRQGDVGKLVRTLEALEKSPAEGAKWIIPIPGLASLFSQIFPGKDTLSSLTPEDVQKVKEIIKTFGESKK